MKNWLNRISERYNLPRPDLIPEPSLCGGSGSATIIVLITGSRSWMTVSSFLYCCLKSSWRQPFLQVAKWFLKLGKIPVPQYRSVGICTRKLLSKSLRHLRLVTGPCVTKKIILIFFFLEVPSWSRINWQHHHKPIWFSVRTVPVLLYMFTNNIPARRLRKKYKYNG